MGEVVQDNACSSAVACIACSPTMDLCAVAQQSGALQIYVRAVARGRALEFTVPSQRAMLWERVASHAAAATIGSMTAVCWHPDGASRAGRAA